MQTLTEKKKYYCITLKILTAFFPIFFLFSKLNAHFFIRIFLKFSKKPVRFLKSDRSKQFN